jgi:hypothetical protein
MSSRVLRVELCRSAGLVSGALVALFVVAGLHVLSTTDQASQWAAHRTALLSDHHRAAARRSR